MSTRVQLVQGAEISQLLERDENNQYKIPIENGTVYFFQDGNIVWDNEIDGALLRTVMGRDEILTTNRQNITLNATAWTDVISLNSNVFPDALQSLSGGGTFALQLHIKNATNTTTNTKQSNSFYSSIVSWYWGDTPSNSATAADEILLHRSGRILQDIYIYAKIEKRGDNSVLSLKSNTDLTIDDLTIKLRQLI